jgi:hypothetical protein
MDDTPQLPRSSGPLDLFRGASFPLRAAQLVLRVPRLRRLAALCAAVTLLIFVLWGWARLAWRPGLLERVWPHPDGAAGWLWQLSLLVAGALAWLLGAATLPLLALAPLEDTLVAATESAVGAPPVPRLASPARPVRQSPPWLAPRSGSSSSSSARRRCSRPQLALPAAAPICGGRGLDAVRLRRVPRPTAGPPRRGLCRGAAGLRAAPRLALGFGLSVTAAVGAALNLFLLPVAVVAGTLLHRSLVSAGTLS